MTKKNKRELIEEILVMIHWSECTETGIDTDYERWKKQFTNLPIKNEKKYLN